MSATVTELESWRAAKEQAAVTAKSLAPAVETGGGGPHPPGMETRVALLEKIAQDTKDVLVGLRADLKEFRGEFKTEMTALRTDLKCEIKELRTELKSEMGELRGDMRDLRSEQRQLIYWFVGALGTVLVVLGGIMAKGFHWIGG